MPRLSAIAEPAVENLLRQLRFAPPEARLRAVERVEELAGEIEEGAEYPVEWLAFRVTGFRGDRAAAAMGTLRGAALLADLSALAEGLSEGVGGTVGAARSAGMVGVADLCARWKISRKTLDRLRRRGLIARRAMDARGRAALVFAPAVVERFAARHGASLGRAAGFTRIDPDTEERLVRRAARYRRVLGWSASRIAERLASRFGRSREAVRGLLLRQGAGLRVEGRARARRSSGRAAMEELARGVEPRVIAARTGVTVRAVVRSAALARRALLAGLSTSGALLASRSPIFAHPDADEVILSPAPVRTGLGGPGARDLLDLLRGARARDPRPPSEELARALAYHYLRFKAAGVIAGLDAQNPRGGDLDAAETWLRWAARLKAELMRPQLHLVMETLEGLLGGAPEDLPRGMHSAPLAELVGVALGALAEAVDQFEPQRPSRVAAGRLAAPAGLAVARACTRWLRERWPEDGARGGRRAAARLTAGVTVADWTRSCTPWQEWLEPDERVRACLGALDEGARSLLTDRFGWGGGPARSLREIAAARRTTVVRAAVLERRALRAAWAMLRGE